MWSQGGGHAPPSKFTLVERRWVWWFSIVVMILTTIPYWIAYAGQGDQYRFTGFVYAVEDGNSYIAKMQSGTYGAWLFRSPYSAHPQRGVLLFLPYILLGKLASPPGLHEQLVALFHLLRIISGLFAIHATYAFLAFFLREQFSRRFGLILAALGGGLGWVLVIIGMGGWLDSLPLEFYSPETFGFLGLFGAPHLSMARAFLLLSILSYMRAVRTNEPAAKFQILKISTFWCLSGLMQPLSTLVIGFLLVLHLSGLAIYMVIASRVGTQVDWTRWRNLASVVVLAGIVPFIFVLYNAYSFISDPYLKLWTGQNILPSPHPAHYLLAFGLVIPFAIVGGIKVLKTELWVGWLPVSWVLALPVLAYAPVNLQRRLPEGIWVAWVLLAMIAVEGWRYRHLESSRTMGLRVLFPLLLCIPSTLFLLAGGVQSARRVAQPVFRPVEEVELFMRLSEKSERGSVVLSAFETGNALPAWAPFRVVIGHGPESVNLPDLRQGVSNIFSTVVSDEDRWDLICENDVNVIFWGPAERNLGGWDPIQAAYLEFVGASGSYQAYQVKDHDFCQP